MIVRELITLLSFKTDEASLSKAEAKIKGVANELDKLGKQLTMKVSLPLLAVGIASVKAASDVEQLQVAFSTMLQSEELATQLIKDLTEFAVKTPFTISGVETSAKQLLAMGISNEKLLPTLKSLGDVAAGLSVPIGRLAYNYGQIATQGKLTSRDLRDFAGAGVPIIDELAKSLKVTKKEIANMVSAGSISFEMVEEAFKSMSSEGGRFANLMDKQSKTLGGLFSNLLDSLIKTAREIGFAIVETFKLKAVVKSLGENLQKVTDWFKKLSPAMKKFIIISTTLVAGIGPLLIASSMLLATLVVLKGAFFAATGASLGFQISILWIPLAIAALLAIMWLFIDDLMAWVQGGDSMLGAFLGKWEDWRDSIISVFSPIVNAITALVSSVMRILGGLLIFVGSVFTGQWRKAWEGIKQIFIGIIDLIGTAINATIESLLLPFRMLGGALSSLGHILPKGWKGIGATLVAAGTVGVQGADVLAGVNVGSDLAGKNNGSQTVTINSKNEMSIPAGTPEEQQQFIENDLRQVIVDENQRMIDGIAWMNQGGE